MADDYEQKILKEFVKRRHPEYKDKLVHWDFVKSCYDGGREWFEKNIFRYLKEGDKEYSDRLKRCYRFNHTREVVDLVDKYIFKMEVARNEEDAPEQVKKFWKFATKSGLTITEFAKQISKNTSIYGRVWIVVDSNKMSDTLTVAEEKEDDSKVYAYIVTPQNMCDVSYDEDGQLNWILIHEKARDDTNPFSSSGRVIDRYRLWTRDDWSLYIIEQEDKDAKDGVDVTTETDEKWTVRVEGPFPHGLGVVPVFSADNIITNDELYSSPSLIDDVAYLDRAVANYLSNLDAIIQDQTFSQLVIPVQAIPEDGQKSDDKLREVGTSRIFTYDSTGGGKPEFISPDVKQAQVLLDVINKNINEIYQTVGLAGERTKEDNALGIDNSSGVAKAYDFERVNSLLAAKADSLETIENKLVQMVMIWSGLDIDSDDKFVSYPDNFDVRGLYDEFEIAARLNLIQAPEEVRREQMETVINKLFPQIGESKRKKLIDSLKDWPVDPIERAQELAKANSNMIGSTGSQKVGGQQDNRVDDAQKGNRKEPKTDTQLRANQ